MTEKTVTGYKFVTSDLKSRNGNQTQWAVGEWQKAEGELELCSNGFHASHTPLDSLQYTYGDLWFIVEARGEVVEGDDKFCAREMRLIQELPVDKILVNFAILCARRCYKNYKAQYPEDKVVFAAIKAAEKCVAIPSKENVDAAWSAASAAWSAAWSAASAAWSAAWSAASAAWSAASAAWSAAESAERSAERSAASAARSAEKRWQQRTLQKLIHKHTKSVEVSASE